MPLKPKSFEEFESEFQMAKAALPSHMGKRFDLEEGKLRKAYDSNDIDDFGRNRYNLYLKILRRLKRKENFLNKGDHEKALLEESNLRKRFQILANSTLYISNIDNAKIADHDLRATQKMAAFGFHDWIKKSVLEQKLMGHLVKPAGLGKTFTAVIFSEMSGGRTVVFALNNSDGLNFIHDFENHQETKKPETKRSVGQCFDKKNEHDRDVVVAGFSSGKAFWNSMDWSSVNLIVCDEADLNSLSPKRHKFLQNLAKEHGIVMVGMSATEEQGSGKLLQNTFPDEIFRMSIPDSLPKCLEMGLVPEQRFFDLYFDLELKVDRSIVKQNKGIQDEDIDNFIRSTAWNQMLLNHYQDNHIEEPALVVFRNNLLADDFVRQAEVKGIRAATYTQEQTLEKRDQLRKDLAEKKLDILVGSRLLGRGLDIPEVSVVYNSTITHSPQIFWQADGRGSRIDPKNDEKTAHIYAVLPRTIKNRDTLEDLYPHERPLSHAAFFDPDYFQGEDQLIDLDKPRKEKHSKYSGASTGKKKGVHVFDLSKYSGIRSVREVSSVVRKLRAKPPDFKGRNTFYAEYIEALEDDFGFSVGLIKNLVRLRSMEMKNHIKKIRSSSLTTLQGEKSDELSPLLKREMGIELTLSEEKKLMVCYQESLGSADPRIKSKGKKAVDLLIRSHLPLIISIAKKMKNESVDINDLIQVGMMGLTQAIEKFDTSNKGRLASYAMWQIFRNIERFIMDNSADIRIPVHMYAEYNMKNKRHSYSDIDEEIITIPSSGFFTTESEVLKRSDLLPDDALNPYQKAIRKEHVLTTRKIIRTLTPREEKVIRMRFGIDEKKDYTLEEVGEDFEVNRERIRQIEAKALSKLRHPSRSKHLAVFEDGEMNWEKFRNRQQYLFEKNKDLNKDTIDLQKQPIQDWECLFGLEKTVLMVRFGIQKPGDSNQEPQAFKSHRQIAVQLGLNEDLVIEIENEAMLKMSDAKKERNYVLDFIENKQPIFLKLKKRQRFVLLALYKPDSPEFQQFNSRRKIAEHLKMAKCEVYRIEEGTIKTLEKGLQKVFKAKKKKIMKEGMRKAQEKERAKIRQLKKEDKERKMLGILTLTEISEKIGMEEQIVQHQLNKHRWKHSELFKKYELSTGEVVEFYNDDLISLVKCSMEIEIAIEKKRAENKKKQRIRKGILSKQEAVEEGWITISQFALKVRIGKGKVMYHIKSYKSYRQHLIIEINMNGKLIKHYSPEMVKVVTDQIKYEKSLPKKAPKSWTTKGRLAKELEVQPSKIKEIADQFRETHTNWYKVLLVKNSHAHEHFSPKLISMIKKEIRQQEKLKRKKTLSRASEAKKKKQQKRKKSSKQKTYIPKTISYDDLSLMDEFDRHGSDEDLENLLK